MIGIAMATVIDAGRERVWRALVAPSERVRWDERLLELRDEAPGYPRVGQRVRWRYRLGSVPVVLYVRPLEVVAEERLHSDLALGLLHFDETFQLVRANGPNGARERTRISLRLCAESSVPVVGGALDRFGVRRVASGFADELLRALRTWCETDA